MTRATRTTTETADCGAVKVRSRRGSPATAKRPEAQRFLNVPRAAQRLGVSKTTVLAGVRDGELPVSFEIEGTDGRTAPVFAVADIETFRTTMLKRLEVFNSEYHRSRAEKLRSLVI